MRLARITEMNKEKENEESGINGQAFIMQLALNLLTLQAG